MKDEREKKALEDKLESDSIAAQIAGIDLITVVKVDHDGHMYGSVTANEVMHLLQEQKNITLDKKNILLKHAIKTTGVHPISVKLKEGVVAEFNLKVMSEEGYRNFQAETAAAE